MRSSASRVPPRFRDRTLAGYHPVTPSQEAALDAARDVIRGVVRSLVLIGPPGVGKTHLAAAIFGECRHPARWLNVADAITTLRMEIGLASEDRDAARTVAAVAAHQGLVVLDDLGRENATDWTGELIYTLVNGRYEAILPTVVTSNRTAADLRAGPYWAAISRLAEDGRLIEIMGPDRRLARPQPMPPPQIRQPMQATGSSPRDPQEVQRDRS